MIPENRVIEELERLLTHEKFNENPRTAIKWFITFKIPLIKEEMSISSYKLKRDIFKYIDEYNPSMYEIRNSFLLKSIIEIYKNEKGIKLKEEELNEYVNLYQLEQLKI